MDGIEDRTPPHFSTLSAFAERLIPSDEGPGAAETGVAEYVVSALEEPSMCRHRPLVDYGLELADHLAVEAHGKVFTACSRQEKDAILRQIQTSESPADRLFFRRFSHLCLEGFLSHPKRGGNRDALGWKFLGYRPGGPEADDLSHDR